MTKKIEELVRLFKEKIGLKEINPYLLTKGEIFFELMLDDNTILYNVEGENIEIKF